MSDAAAKADWVFRVLGIAVGGSSLPGSTGLNDFRNSWKKASAAWQAASETVDAQIGKLQGMLRGLGDADLTRIADLGINGITGNHKVPVMVAIREVGAAGPDSMAKHVASARKAVAAFSAHLTTDPRVGACDGNPFGIDVAIRATLVPALQTLATTLGSAPAH